MIMLTLSCLCVCGECSHCICGVRYQAWMLDVQSSSDRGLIPDRSLGTVGADSFGRIRGFSQDFLLNLGNIRGLLLLMMKTPGVKWLHELCRFLQVMFQMQSWLIWCGCCWRRLKSILSNHTFVLLLLRLRGKGVVHTRLTLLNFWDRDDLYCGLWLASWLDLCRLQGLWQCRLIESGRSWYSRKTGGHWR